jgi:hypothetical protein
MSHRFQILLARLMLSILLGFGTSVLPGDPLQAQDDADLTIVDGLRFQVVALEAALVYVGEGVTTETRDRFLWAIERASTQVPALLEAPPSPSEVFLLVSRDAFRQAVSQLTGLPVAALGTQTTAYQTSRGPRPGLYLDTASHVTDVDALWIVTHELTHLVLQDAFAGTADFPQWFDEGVAEYSAAQVVREHDPGYFSMRDFQARARVAAGARQGANPALTMLQTSTQWIVAHDRGAPVYDHAWLATNLALEVGGRGAVGGTLTPVRNGTGFAVAFQRAFGWSVEQLEATFDQWVAETLLTEFPPGFAANRTAAPANERILFMLTDGSPEEGLTWQFSGPGSCQARGTSRTDQLGVAAYQFFLLEAGQTQCAGTWQVELTGDRGSHGQLEFVFTLP